jgi:hypothetical protein
MSDVELGRLNCSWRQRLVLRPGDVAHAAELKRALSGPWRAEPKLLLHVALSRFAKVLRTRTGQTPLQMPQARHG